MIDCRSALDLAKLSATKTYVGQRPRPAPANSPNGDGLAEPGAPDEFERAQRVARGEIDPIDLQWLSKGFAAFLTGCGAIPLERCLRLPRNDSALRRACRNFWLRRAWRAVGKQLSPWRRSQKLAAAVRDFESRHWQRWRTLEQPPADGSELDVALFQAFRSHARIPFTAMQLHNIASPAGASGSLVMELSSKLNSPTLDTAFSEDIHVVDPRRLHRRVQAGASKVGQVEPEPRTREQVHAAAV